MAGRLPALHMMGLVMGGTLYDEILIPAELDGVHPKAAIGLRNRWMVDRSDIVIAALHRDFGGAAEAVRYAEKRGKEVVRISVG